MDIESLVDVKGALAEFASALSAPDDVIKDDDGIIENQKGFANDIRGSFKAELSLYDESKFVLMKESLLKADDCVALQRPASRNSGPMGHSAKFALILLGVTFALALLAIVVLH